MSTIANPGQDSYRRGALSLMDKHADAIRPAYALTPDERALMLRIDPAGADCQG